VIKYLSQKKDERPKKPFVFLFKEMIDIGDIYAKN